MGTTVAIVVAAGRGSRMGASESKQYLRIADKPILIRTIESLVCIPEINGIVLVTAAGDVDRCRSLLEEYGLTDSVRAIVPGGSERQHSVYAGVKALASDDEWVLVHDGVRPFIRRERVLGCLEAAQETGAATLAVPVKDTIKIVDAAGRIESTPDRRSLWAIHTPQAFRVSLLREAHERAQADGFVGTDDAMLVERIGVTVRVAESDYTNVKITTPDDLPWAEWYVRRMGDGDNG